MNAANKISVVGAGIIGCSIAWQLSKHGFHVVLFDEHPGPFKGISSAGFGSLTPFSDPFYRGEARDFAAKAVGIYRKGWLSEISKISGKHIDFNDHGLIQLCQDTKDIANAQDIVRELESTDYPARMLSVEETRQLEPNLTGDFLASLWVNEPWLDKDQYYTALALAISYSEQIETRYSCAVNAISSDTQGLVVQTRGRETVKCQGAIICNGLHPDPIGGVPRLNMKWIRGDAIAMYTTDGKPLLNRHVYLHDGFITPRTHSEMLLGATYHEEELPSENARRHCDRIALEQLQKLIASNITILPALSKCEVGKVWRNWRPTAPDNYPILGIVPDNERIVLANGFIGLGLTLAPAVARVVAEHFCDASASPFPQCFAPNRPNLLRG
jgi:glycine oxidase